MEFLDSAVTWLNEATGMPLSVHGWIAFLAGVMGVTALNIGLMVLLIRSNRSGHDERVDSSSQDFTQNEDEHR